MCASIGTVGMLLLTFSFPLITLAIPAQHETRLQSYTASKRADKPSQWQIDAATGMFPGIDWAFTAEHGGCDTNQFGLLVESTHMVLVMMEFTGEDLRVAYDRGTGFNRYFMKHSSWFNMKEFNYASEKYANVYNWPTTTSKKDRRQYKTVYDCTQTSWSGGCDKSYKPTAYTPQVPTFDDNYDYSMSNSVVFCPKFWSDELAHVNNRTETKRSLQDIDRLMSYEHVLIHEWFHNTKTDVGNMHQTDVEGDYGEENGAIYGDYRCHHYAWRQFAEGGGIGDIEKKTMYNADSFAWMISYKWHKSAYGWRDDGILRPKIQLNAAENHEEDPEATEDLYKNLPRNEDAVPESVIQQPSSPMPESTTYVRGKCHNCLITHGGCVAVSECRYPQNDHTVDPACQKCTCDVSHDDNNPSTQDLALTDPKCAGFVGKLPGDYKFPPEQSPPPNNFGPSAEQVQCYTPGAGSANPPNCYISRDAMASHTADFCDKVGALDIANLDKGYATDTYNGAYLHISSNKKVTKEDCLLRMSRIYDGCVPAPNTPMNWKYGGENRYDGTLFKINVDGGQSCQRKVNVDGSPMQGPIAKCDSFYQAVQDEFWIYGSGFLSSDFGIELFNQMGHCIGSSVRDWSFECYEKPDADGMEWKAFEHTPIWQKNCFSPVIKGSGGPDIPCNGSG